MGNSILSQLELGHDTEVNPPTSAKIPWVFTNHKWSGAWWNEPIHSNLPDVGSSRTVSGRVGFQLQVPMDTSINHHLKLDKTKQGCKIAAVQSECKHLFKAERLPKSFTFSSSGAFNGQSLCGTSISE